MGVFILESIDDTIQSIIQSLQAAMMKGEINNGRLMSK
jgi:hypothetical protein